MVENGVSGLAVTEREAVTDVIEMIGPLTGEIIEYVCLPRVRLCGRTID